MEQQQGLERRQGKAGAAATRDQDEPQTAA